MAGRQIYHLTTAPEWDAAQREGAYRAAGFDDEGFIHFSNREQIGRTFDKFYAEVPDLVLLTVDVERLPADVSLIDEPGNRGSDEQFPHLYGALPVGAVADVRPFVDDDWR